MVYLWNMVVTSTILRIAGIFEDHAMEQEEGCEASEWSAWSSCSVTCGKGISMRTRSFLQEEKAQMLGCDRQMVQKEMCSAPILLCEGTKLSKNLAISSKAIFLFFSPHQILDSTQRLPKISCQMTCVQPPNGQDGLNVQPHAVKAMNWEHEGSLTAWAGKNVLTLTRHSDRIVQELSLPLAPRAQTSTSWPVRIVP